MNLDNDEALSLAKEYESQVKNLKDEAYRLGWYMRGGVDVPNLLYDTDLEDFEIMRNIAKEHIENTKNARMPLL